MSALTDLFTAMANKIRSKTGGSDTYTPAEMVSDGIDDVYDAGVAAGTTPTQTKSVTAGTSQIIVSPDTGYALSSVTVNPTPSETKTEGPNVSTNKEVTPTSGKLLSKVTITPLTHTATYTPAANTAANDMGANHDKRYVNTSGMIVPSGTKSITSNGNVDVSSYSTANVNVPDPTLSGDAAVGNVLSGKTFYNNSLTKRTGNMTNNGAVAPSGLNCGGSYTIPAGYHNGSGVVTANSLASQTGVDSGKTAVTAAKMFSGYQGWVNGSKVSGTYVQPNLPSGTKEIVITGSGTTTVDVYDYANAKITTTAYPGFDETTLWTNSSPSSSFAAQTVTLSQSYENFDFINITYCKRTTETSLLSSVYLSTADLAAMGSNFRGVLGNRLDTTDRVRTFYPSSNTQIYFNTAYNYASSTQNNNQSIPTKITGLKFKS